MKKPWIKKFVFLAWLALFSDWREALASSVTPVEKEDVLLKKVRQFSSIMQIRNINSLDRFNCTLCPTKQELWSVDKLHIETIIWCLPNKIKILGWMNRNVYLELNDDKYFPYDHIALLDSMLLLVDNIELIYEKKGEDLDESAIFSKEERERMNDLIRILFDSINIFARELVRLTSWEKEGLVLSMLSTYRAIFYSHLQVVEKELGWLVSKAN